MNTKELKHCDRELWSRFCGIVKRVLTDLNSFDARSVISINEDSWAKLAMLLPSGLSRFDIMLDTDGQTTVGVFEGIYKHFPRLAHLRVCPQYGYDGMPSIGEDAMLMLAKSLHNLSNLRHLNLTVYVLDPTFWNPVVDAIRQKSGLESVQIRAQSDAVLPGADALEAMQFGPRLNDAKSQYFPPTEGEEVTLEQWVEAIISVRDRVDCLEYFLSSVDPNLYAAAAVRGMGGFTD